MAAFTWSGDIPRSQAVAQESGRSGIRAIRNPGDQESGRSGIRAELLDFEKGEPVDDRAQDLLGHPRVDALFFGQISNSSQHAVLSGPVDNAHVMGPLELNDSLHQPRPLGQQRYEALVDVINLLSDVGQVRDSVGHRSIMPDPGTAGERPRWRRRDEVAHVGVACPTTCILSFVSYRGSSG